MNDKLIKALLAMDSYNRSYNEGIKISGTSLGDISILQKVVNGVSVNFDSEVLGKDSSNSRNGQFIGFYAIAYQYEDANHHTHMVKAVKNAYNAGAGAHEYAEQPRQGGLIRL